MESNDTMVNKWSWVQSSEEEFEKRRLNETYFRIYFKDEYDNDVIVYKFWSKDWESALSVLEEYRKDHSSDGRKYFYSTSGYFLNHEHKRFDTVKDMHEDFANSPYNYEDRMDDIHELSQFCRNFNSDERRAEIEKLKKAVRDLNDKILKYEQGGLALENRMRSNDVSSASEDEMTAMTGDMYKLNELFYDLEDAAYLMENGHKRNESWSLCDHIVSDLQFNLGKMLKDENCGYPQCVFNRVAFELNVKLDGNFLSVDDKDYDRVSKLAYKMWKDELYRIYYCAMAYEYFDGYGIFDEKEDKEMLEFAKNNELRIPYMEGTDNQIDHRKLNSMKTEMWEEIFDWLKVNGRNLWI